MTLQRRLRALSGPIIITGALALACMPAAAAASARRSSPSTGSERAHTATDATCPDAALAPDADDLPLIAASVLCLVNVERGRVALPPLSSNTQLSRASQPMADRMVQEQFFAHDSPDGRTLLDRIKPTGYLPASSNWVVGENLAWGSGPLATPQAIVAGWMNSPGHRANILAGEFRDIGIGLALGSPISSYTGGATYVTDFGQRAPAKPVRTAASHRVSSTAKRVVTRVSRALPGS